MNLEDLGNNGEFIGAIAVVVSIVYLTFQVRRNTQSLDAAIDNTYVEFSLRWTDTFSSLESCALMLKGFNDPSSLSDEETLQFSAYMVRFVMVIDCLQSMHSHSALSEERWGVAQLDIVVFLGTKGGRMWWNGNRSGFTTSTVRVIDRALEESGVPAFELVDWRHE